MRLLNGSAASPLRGFLARTAEQESMAQQQLVQAFADNLRSFAGQVERRAR
jgi:hypothetical protein